VSVSNRLTADQLAALEPGATVTIESGVDIGRPRHAAGTVARVTGPDILVNVKSRHGVTRQERYRRRDGARIGGVSRAEPVNASPGEHPATPRPLPRMLRSPSRLDATRERQSAESPKDVRSQSPTANACQRLPTGAVAGQAASSARSGRSAAAA